MVFRQVAGVVLAVVAIVQVSSSPEAWAQSDEPTPVLEILEDGSRFDGRIVTVEGELVGDYGFRRDGFMWTQLNDDSYARAALVDGGPLAGSNIGIGIRMPSELATSLDPVGGYRLEGPVIRVTGTWRYHDPDRGGESYLDVASFVLTRAGRRLEEGPDWFAFSAGLVLIAAALVLRLRRRNTI